MVFVDAEPTAVLEALQRVKPSHAALDAARLLDSLAAA